MTKTEDEMLEFLTSKDNLPHVIEVVRRANEIERLILKKCWDNLKHCVQEALTFATVSDRQMKLEVHENKDPWRMELWYIDPELDESTEECLLYSIFFRCDGASAQLCYAVRWWSNFKNVEPELKRLAPVVELMKKLDEMEFDEAKPNWFVAGWRTIDVANRYDFVTRVGGGDAESVLQEVSTNFCALVNKTHDLVIQANKQIAAATSK